jgi:hypothetical protein
MGDVTQRKGWDSMPATAPFQDDLWVIVRDNAFRDGVMFNTAVGGTTGYIFSVAGMINNTYANKVYGRLRDPSTEVEMSFLEE